MKALFAKLKRKAGETFVESLAAILIFSMASVVMYSMVASAAKINTMAKEMDEKNQTHMIAVEKGLPSSKTGSAQITFTMADGTLIASETVDIYGGTDDSLYTYFLQTQAGVTP